MMRKEGIFFKKVLSNLNKPLLVFESNSGRIIFANRTASRIFGYNGSEFENLKFSELLSDKKEKVKNVFSKKKASLKLEFVNKSMKKFPALVELRKFNYQKKEYVSSLIYQIKGSGAGGEEGIKYESWKDPLTQVLNYNALIRELEEVFNTSKSGKKAFSIIMIDIDNLDFINEALGIAQGDKVLKMLSHLLTENTRANDIIGRIGGDSFLIVLPGTGRKGACNLGDRILEAINSISFTKGRKVIKITSTISVVSYPQDRAENVTDLIRKAEALLLSAKKMGGNTVVAFDEYPRALNLVMEAKRKKDYALFQNQLQLLSKKLHSTILDTVIALGNAVKAKDYYTEKHSEFTAYYAGLLAKELNLEPDEIDTVKIGAILHDIGKIGISDEILNKPGPLDEKERELINLHPEIGANIIRTIKFLKDIIPIILYHHERYDGKNNRWGLKGKEIPLGARIVSVIDVYHALVSERPYRKALSQKEAIQIIKRESGKMFDPDVVKAFLKILKFGGEFS